MTDKEKIIKELKEALDSLDITNKYRLNIIRAIEYLQEKNVSEELEKENKIEALADIIFYAAKHGYMPYNTQDEDCAMEIAKKKY